MSPSRTVRIIGKSAKFHCEVNYYDDYTIQWTYNDGPLPPNARVDERNKVLSINPLEVENTGKYACEANSRSGVGADLGKLSVISEY